MSPRRRRAKGEGTIFQDQRGYWIAEVTLPNGKTKRKASNKQRVVSDWLLVQRDFVRHGQWTENDRTTLGTFLDRYMADVAAHTVRPTTYESYECLIRVHIKPELGMVRLSQLRPEQIQTLYARKLDAGLSPRTVQYIHGVLHKTLEQAMRWGLVVRNVTDLVDPPTVRRVAPTTWSPEDVRRFLQSVRDHPYYPIYLLAVSVGMREGELLGLHSEDIDWNTGTIHVKHSVQSLTGKGMVITEPKTEKAKRRIFIPVHVLRELESLKGNQGLIFHTRTGKPLSARNVVRHFKAAIERAGVPDIRFHDLRHTCATLLFSQDVHPKVVQELLGHSQISLTLDTYSHAVPSMQSDAAEKMLRLLGVG